MTTQTQTRSKVQVATTANFGDLVSEVRRGHSGPQGVPGGVLAGEGEVISVTASGELKGRKVYTVEKPMTKTP